MASASSVRQTIATWSLAATTNDHQQQRVALTNKQTPVTITQIVRWLLSPAGHTGATQG